MDWVVSSLNISGCSRPHRPAAADGEGAHRRARPRSRRAFVSHTAPTRDRLFRPPAPWPCCSCAQRSRRAFTIPRSIPRRRPRGGHMCGMQTPFSRDHVIADADRGARSRPLSPRARRSSAGPPSSARSLTPGASPTCRTSRAASRRPSGARRATTAPPVGLAARRIRRRRSNGCGAIGAGASRA